MAETKYRRKLTAILSADVQGYSRLMSHNEDQTVTTLTSYRQIMSGQIRKFRGRVVDSPGDNLLAEFGSVVDAVRCAFKIQKALQAKNRSLPKDRQMVYRIGINLGDIIHEGDRLYGDGVNIAARLESLADGGGICISGTAYDQVKDKIKLKFAYLGEKKVKNIPKPVKAYKVLMQSRADLPFIFNLKAEVLPMLLVIATALYSIYWHYFRFLLADFEIVTNYQLINPSLLLTTHQILLASSVAFLLLLLVFLIRKKNISALLLQGIRGGFLFAAVFFVIHLPLTYLVDRDSFSFNRAIYESKHLFVEVLKDEVVVRSEPSTTSSIIETVNSGSLFLQSDIGKQGKLTWNKVMMTGGEYGWILRVIPAKYGAAANRLTLSAKFRFTYLDAAVFILAFLSFGFGGRFYRRGLA